MIKLNVTLCVLIAALAALGTAEITNRILCNQGLCDSGIVHSSVTTNCPIGSTWKNNQCEMQSGAVQCPQGAQFNGSHCITIIMNDNRVTQSHLHCSDGYSMVNGQCIRYTTVCPSGSTWQNNQCVRQQIVQIVVPQPSQPSPIVVPTIPIYPSYPSIPIYPTYPTYPSYPTSPSYPAYGGCNSCPLVNPGLCHFVYGNSQQSCTNIPNIPNIPIIPNIPNIPSIPNIPIIPNQPEPTPERTIIVSQPSVPTVNHNIASDINIKPQERTVIVSQPSAPAANHNISNDININHVINNNNTVNSPTNVITNNTNTINVHAGSTPQCSGGQTTVVTNGESKTVCHNENTSQRPLATTTESREIFTTTSRPIQPCCVLIAPRQCRSERGEWVCFHRKHHRCGQFCTRPTMYLKPRASHYSNSVLVMPPPPPQVAVSRPHRYNSRVDCSGCISGGYQCSPHCYQYDCQDDQGQDCGFIDQDNFCQSQGGSGCSNDDGCF